jgi:hypothetical protein
MRKRKQSDGITVNAIAGTHVVFLGLDLTKKFHKGFKGFAIKRRDHSDGEKRSKKLNRILLSGRRFLPLNIPGKDFSGLITALSRD